jgi:hypothetical protein
MVTMDEFGVFTRDESGNKIYETPEKVKICINDKLLYEYDKEKSLLRLPNSIGLSSLISQSKKNSEKGIDIRVNNMFGEGFMDFKGIKKLEIVPDKNPLKNTYYNIINYIKGL